MNVTEEQILADAERRRQAAAERDRQRIEAEQSRVKTATAETEALCNRLASKIASAPIGSKTGPDPRIAQAKALLDAAGIPLRHKRRIERTDSPWQRTVDALTAKLGNGFIVALTGTQGTGKTQVGSALIYAATDKAMPARYALAMDFFIALKETFDNGAKKSEANIIAEFVKPKLLVLDECDERSESKWENTLLFHMINQRYNNLTDTLLISRKSEDEFKLSLGQSIQSRIQETGATAHCDWPSFRELSAQP